MDQYLFRLLFFTSGLLLATTAGIIRYRSIDARYKPFIFYLCVGVINEVVSFFCGWLLGSNLVNNNLFMLAELLLLNWQFKKWHGYAPGIKWYDRAAVFFCLLFAAKAAWKGLDAQLFYFNTLYCCYLVSRGLDKMSGLLIFSPERWYKNADFIMASAMVIYFTCRVIVETFWIYGLFKSALFRNEVFTLLMWINLFVNVMYLYAILWMQKKPAFITFYGQR